MFTLGIGTEIALGAKSAGNLINTTYNSLRISSAAKGGGSFSRLMSPSEAVRYNTYWSNNAPRIYTPNSRMIWNRISSRTSQLEKSLVTYDKAGRMNYRIDFSTHMRPAAHSNPHLHMFEYSPFFVLSKGKETLFNFW